MATRQYQDRNGRVAIAAATHPWNLPPAGNCRKGGQMGHGGRSHYSDEESDEPMSREERAAVAPSARGSLRAR